MNQRIDRAETILAELQKRQIRSRTVLRGLYKKDADYRRGSALPVVEETFEPFAEDGAWGGSADSHAWFYVAFTAAEPAAGCRRELVLETNRSAADAATNPQFLVYLNDEPVRGGDNNHRALPVAAGENRLFLYAYSGMQVAEPLSLSLSLVERDEAVERLCYDLSVPVELLRLLPMGSEDFARLIGPVEAALKVLDLRPASPDFPASVASATVLLERTLYAGGGRPDAPKVICVGHTHLDVAWLWSVRQTREKAQRSFANALSLMREYPYFRFASSQPVLYQFVKEEAPNLYAEIKARAAEGRWEPEGGMWLEPDCNLIAGESLVRQLLYGKRFFREEFGRESKVVWLPDTFGFPATMPQILKKSGIETFVTSKINWNDTNDFPYDLFSWQGPDGSRVDSYFLTAQDDSAEGGFSRYTTYLGEGSPSHVRGTWNRFRQKDYTDEVLLAYGYGDGGGGPTRDYCEKLERLSRGMPGCPTVEFASLSEFFARQKERCRGRELPVWTGELYLEFHRGTYTSIGKNKKSNRRGEYLLRNTELYCMLAALLLGTDFPAEELEACWKLLLLNQFHDILPGSAIAAVYEQSDADYAELFRRAGALLEGALRRLSPGAGYVAFNPTSQPFRGDVSFDGEYVCVEGIPALGAIPVVPTVGCRVAISEFGLENDFFRVRFDSAYRISSLYDKRCCREVFVAGEPGNQLVAYEDLQPRFDAWELKEHYREKSYPLDDVAGVEFLTQGNRRGIRVRRRYLSSTVEQTVWLYEHNDYVDVESRIDWQTEHTVLKALFPFDVRCERATCDVAFGSVERSLCRNTSWDRAKFEVCAHRFVDYSESGYGVAVLSDCKYGWGLGDRNLSLTLLKCATSPNENADKGEHVFRYAIYPHAGSYAQSATLMTADQYNNPVFLRSCDGSGEGEGPFSLLTVTADNVAVEAVKRAEAGDGMIVRLVERKCRRTQVELKFCAELAGVVETDLMENRIGPLEHGPRTVELDIQPFEIRTLLVYFKQINKKEIEYEKDENKNNVTLRFGADAVLKQNPDPKAYVK